MGLRVSSQRVQRSFQALIPFSLSQNTPHRLFPGRMVIIPIKGWMNLVRSQFTSPMQVTPLSHKKRWEVWTCHCKVPWEKTLFFPIFFHLRFRWRSVVWEVSQSSAAKGHMWKLHIAIMCMCVPRAGVDTQPRGRFKAASFLRSAAHQNPTAAFAQSTIASFFPFTHIISICRVSAVFLSLSAGVSVPRGL